MEIENIFFKYSITKTNLTYEELLKLSNADFSRIMEIMGESSIAELTEKFDESIKIINLYKSLVGDLGEIPVATQYEEAQEWLTKVNDVITRHIITYELDQTENIQILENSVSSLRRFTDLFKGGMLSEPIFDMADFHDLLNKSGLDLATKVAVKKAVGMANYNLVIQPLTPNEKNEYINKYRLVYEKKSIVYQNEIEKITEICAKNNIKLTIDDVLNQINNLNALYPELTYKGIQNAVVCILLKQELDLYEEFIQDDYEEEFKVEFKNKLVENCENLLIISRKHPPKESKEDNTEKKTEPQNDQLLIEGKSVVLKAKEIITSEYELLDKKIYKDRENFYRLAAINNAEDSELTLTIIVDSIKQSLALLEEFLKEYQESPDLYQQKCKEQILNITDFIETYSILKKRLETSEKKQSMNESQNKSPIVYLTNEDNKAFIIYYLENEHIPVANRRHLKGILTNLANGNRTGSEKEYAVNNYTVLRIARDAITLSYMPLANNTVLVLFADQIANNIRKTVKSITSNYSQRINEFISKASSLEELDLLLNEQAEIRDKINGFLIENKKNKIK